MILNTPSAICSLFMSKFPRRTGKQYVILYHNVTISDISKCQMVTFNNLVKFPCPINTLQFPLAFCMMKIFCAKENYFRFSIVQHCYCGTFAFGILMDFQFIIDCGEGRFILHKSPISDVLYIFVLNKNRGKEFLLVSFEAFEVVHLRVFPLGCCTLSLGVHCPVF